MRTKAVHEASKENMARVQVQQHSLSPDHAAQPVGMVAALLNCQHIHGNRFVQRMLATTATIQRQCACGGTCTKCQSPGTNPEQDIFQQILQRKGSGLPLDTNVRAFMETRFGQDFSGVRLHTDAQAAQTARQLSAVAYTVGRDIFFGEGQYQPQSREGRRLLAHELTHVVQQGGQPVTSQTELQVSEPEDRLEQEAEQVAEAVVAEGAKFHFQLMGTGEEEEQPYTQTLRAGKPTLANNVKIIPQRTFNISTVVAPVLQRLASFVPGTVRRTFNLAANMAAGVGAGGFTPPLLNGTQILSAATARTAIRRPDIGGESDMTTGGVNCWINSVPTNEGGFDMTLPTSGPWTTVTQKANVFARGLVPLPACNSPGDTSFSVNGQPSDASLATHIETHERHHATDHETVFNAIMVPWDNALTLAQITHQIFRGADVTACEAALFAAMGGTPDAIATNLNNSWINANNAFHASAAGRGGTISNPTTNSDCTVSSVDLVP